MSSPIKRPDTNSEIRIDINDYEDLGKIYSGSNRIVKKVRNKKTKEIYAAKIIYHSGNEEKYKKMIKREIGNMKKFNHPTINKLIGYSPIDFSGNQNITILMNFIEKGSLRDLLIDASRGRAGIDFTETARQIILIGIARGMMILHEKHIFHRDLKPENILIGDNFHPMITDFGLSKFIDKYCYSLTQSQNVGTSFYTAPESYLNSKFYEQSDVYAFGFIMYEVITGKYPFPEYDGKNEEFLLKKVAKEDKRPILDDSIKKPIRKLIEKCWSKDPGSRPTFKEIYNKLAFNKDDPSNDDFYNEKDDDNEFKYFLDNVNQDDIDDYIEEIDEPIEINTMDQINKLKYDLDYLKKENLMILPEIDQMKEAYANAQRQNISQQEEINQLQYEKDQIKNELHSMKETLANFQKYEDSHREEMDKLKSILELRDEQMERKINELQSEKDQIKDELRSMKETLANFQKKEDLHLEEINKLKLALESHDKQMTWKINELQSEKDQIEDELRSMKENLINFRKNEYSHREEINKLKSTLELHDQQMAKKINAQMKKIILNNKSQPIISNIEQKSNQDEEFQLDIIKRKVYRRSPSLNHISKNQSYLSMKKYSIHYEVKPPFNKRVVKMTLNGSEEFQSQPIGRSKNHQITSKNFNGVLFNNGDSFTLYQNETDINKNQIVGISFYHKEDCPHAKLFRVAIPTTKSYVSNDKEKNLSNIAKNEINVPNIRIFSSVEPHNENGTLYLNFGPEEVKKSVKNCIIRDEKEGDIFKCAKKEDKNLEIKIKDPITPAIAFSIVVAIVNYLH